MPASSQRIHGPAGAATQDPPGLPPQDLPGLDRSWSRVVVAPDAEGTPRSWHVLDTGHLLAARGETVEATLLCVHGNPTWSYLWRRVLAQAPPGWRVVAVDQLGMGFSERTGTPRRLAQRVEDLGRLTDVLEVSGPVYTLAHDWGGPVSLGWALRHQEDLAGVVLTNTAVHQPAESAPPALIRLARAPGLLARVCQQTPVFVRGTTALSWPRLPREVVRAFARPYLTPGRRAAVADFVRDIPFEEHHPSRAALDGIAEGLSALAEVPALMVWGPRDPVFGERYLDDLLRRLPHADVQRYPSASHLVLEDRPEGVEVIWRWLQDRRSASGAPGSDGTGTAAGTADGAEKKTVTAKELDAIVASVAMQVPATYQLVNYVINSGNIITASAQITLQREGKPLQGVCIGDGPIDAAFRAIDQIIGHHYELDDFQIQAVTEGKEAVGKAVIKLRAAGRLYSGSGISTDILGASLRAYLNAVNKIIYEEA